MPNSFLGYLNLCCPRSARSLIAKHHERQFPLFGYMEVCEHRFSHGMYKFHSGKTSLQTRKSSSRPDSQCPSSKSASSDYIHLRGRPVFERCGFCKSGTADPALFRVNNVSYKISPLKEPFVQVNYAEVF